MPGADQYTFWSTDGSGNFISNLTGGAVSGSSSALESLENSFHQDLNGDGAAGLYAQVLDGHLGGQTITASGGGPTALIGGPNDILNAGAGADTFVFRTNLGSNTINGFTSGTDSIQFDHAVFADYAAVQSHMQQVGSDVVITQDAQDLVTLHNVLISNLHASDFQFI
jgi:Ca2+-binding RTX toxin-like protein